MSDDFSYAKHVLLELGFDVRPIKTGDEESADWRASIAGETVLVEEKTKLEDPSDVARRNHALTSGDPFDSHVPFIPDNRLSGITRKAVGQLSASAEATDHDYRLIWLTTTGHTHEGKFHQYIATLYGSTNIVERNRVVPIRRCYFVRNSEFFRHRDSLDGAVVAESDQDYINLKLCINPLSPRYQQLKASATRRAFGTAVQDPLVDEVEGGAFVADCDVDRSNENAVLEYLRNKYKTDYLMTMDMGMSSVSMAVRTSDG